MRWTMIALVGLGAACLAAARPGGDNRDLPGYQKRRLRRIKQIADWNVEMNRPRHQSRGLKTALARLWLEEDVSEANTILEKVYWPDGREHFMPFVRLERELYAAVRILKLFGPNNGSRKKLLDENAARNLHELLWTCLHDHNQQAMNGGVAPGHGAWMERHHPRHHFSQATYTGRAGVNWGNQNHDWVFRHNMWSQANVLGDIPQYADRFRPSELLQNGAPHPELEEPRTYLMYPRVIRPLKDERELKRINDISLSEYAGQAESFWKRRIEWMGRHGIFDEGDGYRGLTIPCMYNVMDFSEEPSVRAKMSEILDVAWFNFALQTVDGMFGGPKGRAPLRYTKSGTCPESDMAKVYFGLDRTPGSAGTGRHGLMNALFSDYRPPDLVRRILKERRRRGSYAYVQRVPQYWGPTSLTSVRTIKYTYVTPHYVVGVYMDHPADRIASTPGDERFEGVCFPGEPRLWMRLWPPTSGDPASYDCLQHGPIIIARRDPTFHDDKPSGVRITLSADSRATSFDRPEQRKGWYFGRAGDGYYAVRPVGEHFTSSVRTGPSCVGPRAEEPHSSCSSATMAMTAVSRNSGSAC